MAARAIWKGSISFGLVNIPIQVFSTTQNENYTSFSQLCDKGHKIRYKKWCPVKGREVHWSEIKKGHEITKDNYVVIEKEDLDKIKLKTNNTIEVKEFRRNQINYDINSDRIEIGIDKITKMAFGYKEDENVS
jgi:DNA end-binding protein Ku